MSAAKLTAFGLVTMVAVGCGAPEPQPEPAADAAPPPQFAVTGEHPCDPVGDVRFICDMVSPEDIVVVPGAEWAIVSGAREGGRINLVNVGDKTRTVLFPTPDNEMRLDAEAYPDCPGPLDLANPAGSVYHGLYLAQGSDDAHTLLVVHHGSRESNRVSSRSDAGTAPPDPAWTAPPARVRGRRPPHSVAPSPAAASAPPPTAGSEVGSVWQAEERLGVLPRARTPRRTASRCPRTARPSTSPAGPRRS